MSDKILDGSDAGRARRYFHLPWDTVDEVLARRVLHLAGTGVPYPALPSSDRSTAVSWATLLGSYAPERNALDQVAIPEDAAKHAARRAVTELTMLHPAGALSSLASRLLPGATGRHPQAVLAALGYRVVDRHVRIGPGDQPNEELLPDDRYASLAAQTPGTLEIDDDPAWATTRLKT